jgi:hypothetical protein
VLGRADGKPFSITGFLGYVPPRRSTGSGRKWVVLAAGARLGTAAFVVLGLGARRRRRAPSLDRYGEATSAGQSLPTPGPLESAQLIRPSGNAFTNGLSGECAEM